MLIHMKFNISSNLIKVMKLHTVGQELYVVPGDENFFSVLSRCFSSIVKFLRIKNIHTKKRIITVHVEEYILTCITLVVGLNRYGVIRQWKLFHWKDSSLEWSRKCYLCVHYFQETDTSINKNQRITNGNVWKRMLVLILKSHSGLAYTCVETNPVADMWKPSPADSHVYTAPGT
jgi:hypothetical protein